MSSTQIKELIKARIDEADDRLLKMVHAMVEAYHESDEAYAYDMNGNPISKDQIKKEMREGLEEARRGNYITLEQLKKKSEEWMKRSR